jgi:hypothetical protein
VEILVVNILLKDLEERCFGLISSKVLLGKLISLFCDVLHLFLVLFHIFVGFEQVAEILSHGVIVLFGYKLMIKPFDFE